MPRKVTTIRIEVPKTRDLLMVAVINGVTKAGVTKDLKKEASKKACRKKVSRDEY